MDTWARTLTVAIASLVIGFLVSSLNGIEDPGAGDASYVELVAEANKPVDVKPEPYVPPVVPQPVPHIAPTVAFEFEPIPVTTPLPVAEPEPWPEAPDPDPDPNLTVPSLAGVEEEGLEFVGLAQATDMPLTDGFDGLPSGMLTRMSWHAGESLYGSSVPTPVLVAEGTEPGPTVCLTGAVHGDELNGIEIVRRVMYSLDPEKLTGRVVGVPIVNLQGFERHSRYLADRRDLNRFFPGNPRGSSASRIAYSFFERVIRHCDALVDLHTGSFHRTNLPQLRANLANESVAGLTQGFGGLVVLHSKGGMGTLRAAAVKAGIPAVTVEAGEPLRVDDDAVDHSVKGVFNLLDSLSMYDRRSFWGTPEPTYYGSMWVRADKGGMLIGDVKLGKRVKQGDVLGTVTDPITNFQQQIVAPQSGRVIGMALNQFVMPGYAAFHLGVEASSIEDMPSEPGSEDIDHSMALNAMMEERDDSDDE
ncbi:MAG: succinylglutamate desuccinylase/aspartoacylase family protein [Pseudomonadales bacterium]|jgi:hypothetical protein